MLIIAPDKTTSGIQDSMTTVRSDPLMNATTKPPKKVATNCMNCPTWNERGGKQQRNEI